MNTIVLEQLRSHVKRRARFGFRAVTAPRINKVLDLLTHSEIAQF